MSHSLLDLPSHTQKPRTVGITSINDPGIPLRTLAGILDDYADFLDVAKLGVGSAYVTPNLREKIELYRAHDVSVYFGGTLFEKFYSQNKFTEYLGFLEQYDISWIEISNGTIDIPLMERMRLVKTAARSFTVLGEVGCKDAEVIMPPSQWIEELKTLQDCGCRYVITEGRDSGTSGIYRPSGEMRMGLISDIIRSVGPENIIFEAPTQKSQMILLNEIGVSANFGNVNPRDLLILEAQRRGLRNETFYLTEEHHQVIRKAS